MFLSCAVLRARTIREGAVAPYGARQNRTEDVKSLGNVIDPLHVINGISLEQLLTDLQVSLKSDLNQSVNVLDHLTMFCY